jgi:hypothetical protein
MEVVLHPLLLTLAHVQSIKMTPGIIQRLQHGMDVHKADGGARTSGYGQRLRQGVLCRL